MALTPAAPPPFGFAPGFEDLRVLSAGFGWAAGARSSFRLGRRFGQIEFIPVGAGVQHDLLARSQPFTDHNDRIVCRTDFHFPLFPLVLFVEHAIVFAAVFDQRLQLVEILSPDGVVLEANQSSLAFAGLERKDVIGRYFWDTPWWRHST